MLPDRQTRRFSAWSDNFGFIMVLKLYNLLKTELSFHQLNLNETNFENLNSTLTLYGFLNFLYSQKENPFPRVEE